MSDDVTKAGMADDGADVAARTATVSETGKGPFGTLIRLGRHTVQADEPVGAGGLDAGPNPYDLLMGALGACTTMTVRMYAQRKGLKLERVEARIQQLAARSRGAPQDVFEREIELVGELSDAERERLLTIAEHCPVSRTLAGGSAIRTYLAGGLDDEGD